MRDKIKIAITTVGCRANQADSAALARQLSSQHTEIVGDFTSASVILVNTCCVTEQAERDCRKTIRRALRESPDGRIIAIGCAVNAIDEFGVDIGQRVEIIAESDGSSEKLARLIAGENTPMDGHVEPMGSLPGALGRSRALLKIQNGCSHCCSYCIVPKARGKERSLPEARIREEIKGLLEQNYLEIVITGVQLGAWGRDLPGKPKLSQLIGKIASEVAPGRIRLSSIEPWAVDPDLVGAVARHPQICPHLHLPLQSGDDRVLAAMGRGYTGADFLGTVQHIKQTIPNIALGTDVILGFPGEDEAAYEHTIETLKSLEPAYVHAFTYSERPGTRAATFSNRPPAGIAKHRCKSVRSFGQEAAFAYRTAQAGGVRQVLIEQRKNGILQGITDNFIAVSIENAGQSPGDLIDGKLEKPVRGQNRVVARPV